MKRREFVTRTGIVSVAGALLPGVTAQAVQAAPYETEFPDMIAAYMAGQLNRLSVEWDAKRSLIRTREQMAARNRFVREKAVEMVGGFPERNPLGARVVKV